LQCKLKGKKMKIVALAKGAFVATAWHMWKERNSRVFQNQPMHKIMVFRAIYEDLKDL